MRLLQLDKRFRPGILSLEDVQRLLPTPSSQDKDWVQLRSTARGNTVWNMTLIAEPYYDGWCVRHEFRSCDVIVDPSGRVLSMYVRDYSFSTPQAARSE
jgi:hypothetical protein